ncbi:hypothetical protein [Haliea sp.]|jgi:hypothetical protein|uniref:hypothetical protein n=1 Tax=Haliea sp. TaxID=1932666 RepID=UPI0025BD826B|nr:hypothetical protein [Haliea sp.]|tara:strand:+ start:13573 stop:14568 length:996 start_codon:yes stop_codon:yes gene_type:complete
MRTISSWLFIFLFPTWAIADIRALSLESTLGWEIENVSLHVTHALENGNTTFFATGGIACAPIAVPPEYLYLVTSQHTIHCGCVRHYENDEEADRERHQLTYARAYNIELLARLTAQMDAANSSYVVDQLPSREVINNQSMWLGNSIEREVSNELLSPLYVDTPEGNAHRDNQLQPWKDQLGDHAQVLGLLGYIGVDRYHGAKYPSVVNTSKGLMDGRVVGFTPISSVRDKALPGAHVTFIVEAEQGFDSGWGRITFHDDYLVSGTIYLGRSIYRLISPFADNDGVLFLALDRENLPYVNQQIAARLPPDGKILELDARHIEINQLWEQSQ